MLSQSDSSPDDQSGLVIHGLGKSPIELNVAQ